MSQKNETTIELRFYQSGTVAWVGVKTGDQVKKGQVLAKLDDALAKIDLEIDLANYRRTRAEFEKVAREYPNPQTEEEKGIKEIAQAKLDTSVKKVEQSKYHQQKLSLLSPVEGTVLSTNNLIAGLNITPSRWPILIKPN